MYYACKSTKDYQKESRENVKSIAAVIKEAWQEKAAPDLPFPNVLYICIDGRNGQTRIKKLAFDDEDGRHIKISKELHEILRNTVINDLKHNVESLLFYLEGASACEGWAEDDGGQCDLMIGMSYGHLYRFDHYTRLVDPKTGQVEYDGCVSSGEELIGLDEPSEELQGPVPV